jgi:hypothetical protein
MVACGDVPHPQLLPELSIKPVGSGPFLPAGLAPTVPLQPPGGHHHQGSQHVQVVGVGDLVAAMDAPEPLDDLLPLGMGEPVVDQLQHQQGGVQRPLAWAGRQLPRLVQQRGDGGDAIGRVEGELQAHQGVPPGEVHQDHRAVDLVGVSPGVQLLDPVQVRVTVHGLAVRFSPGAVDPPDHNRLRDRRRTEKRSGRCCAGPGT